MIRMIDFKGYRFEKDIILLCVRWYLAYPPSYRNLEEVIAMPWPADSAGLLRFFQCPVQTPLSRKFPPYSCNV